MLGLPLTFAAPMVLGALVLLPALWWLLRLTPPRPRLIAFPPTRLLVDISRREETPKRSPWWLTLLRLLITALVILALAGPVWRPSATPAIEKGVLWLLVDNGWTSAEGWNEELATANAVLRRAAETGAPILLAATADGPNQTLTPMTAEAAAERLRALQPRSWEQNRTELLPALRTAAQANAPRSVVWVSDGLEHGVPGTFQRELTSLLGKVKLSVYSGLPLPLGLKNLDNNAEAMTVTVLRSNPDTPQTALVRALDMKGLPLGETRATFAPGERDAVATFELPVELRNDIARVEVVGENAAGAVQLVDDSWRRRTVGLISGGTGDQAQPLLSPLYYLRRALSPYADLRVPGETDLSVAIPRLIETGVSVIVLADIGRLPDAVASRLDEWVRAGGTLLRFAGPRMAGGTDALIPVALRTGDRSLGGSLSWEEPQHLASFSASSPFAGLPVPEDITVTRQVLAEPTADLPDRTWAMLQDGTPLVTAAPHDRGTLVLFHVTADTSWSNLPLSGSFVEMLRRIVSFSNTQSEKQETADQSITGSTTETRNVLPPLRLLDGYGRFEPPAADVTPIASATFTTATPSRVTPPGLYGSDDGFRALNLLAPDSVMIPFDPASFSGQTERLAYPDTNPLNLDTGFFSAAFLLLLLDALAVILLAGGLARLKLLFGGAPTSGNGPRHSGARQTGTPLSLLLGLGSILALSAMLAAMPLTSAHAQEADAKAIKAAGDTHLAYVITGNAEIDSASKAGLMGLSYFLADHTALEPGDPIGVNIDSDELAFFPLIYWPVDPSAPRPSDEAIARVDAFMRNGGTILFDTRDALIATGIGTTPANERLRQILDGLDIPALEPVPPDHVLTKAFYLLQDFPGRYDQSPLWVASSNAEATNADGTAPRPVRSDDGVSPILITGNDFAAAWAINDTGTYLYPTVPNDPDQREHAFRTGVNIVMYCLTGNYKADQVHVPSLLERLGQ